MTIQYRGHDVVDQEQRMIGTIDDVLYDAEGSNPPGRSSTSACCEPRTTCPIEVGLHRR